MGMMLNQINTWNFDLFKFAAISKDHPLVSMAYIILQTVSLHFFEIQFYICHRSSY